MLLLAAILSLVVGALVAVSGDERRVKLPFAVLCVACAALCTGLWVEITQRPWAFAAARLNMTASPAITCAALLAINRMLRVPLHRWALLILGGAVASNVVTVWFTDAYFTGDVYEYPWGLYVAGNPRFLITPLLLTATGLYGFALAAIQLRRAHPLDRNRAKYVLFSYVFLNFAQLDFLPHFGIDLFGGPIVGITIPLFLATFGYSCLRYRLIVFGDLVGYVAGWILAAMLLVIAYAIVLTIGAHWFPTQSEAHVAAAIAALATFATLGHRIPDWAERIFGAAEADIRRAVERFSDELLSILDEPVLLRRVEEFCNRVFDSLRTFFVPAATLGANGLASLALELPVVEAEVARRKYAIDAPLFGEAEVLVPIVSERRVLGALALAARRDGALFSGRALQSLRVLGNLFTIALGNARRAAELEQQHQLDRYLAPQIVETVLAGQHDLIEAKRRVVVTIFFSDLQGFSALADTADPEVLSGVLNEYLSEMSEIAFSHGGTLDKFIGDAVMVFFGAPVPCDPSEQAVRCVDMALEMQAALRRLNGEWADRGLLAHGLVCRMGVHTGEAVVGSFGSRNRLEYTAIGRAVNLASRLEGKCEPGAVLVSGDTWELVRHRFRGTARGQLTVKGFASPVEAFQIDVPDESETAKASGA
jgi:class 3 adenylate cyclase